MKSESETQGAHQIHLLIEHSFELERRFGGRIDVWLGGAEEAAGRHGTRGRAHRRQKRVRRLRRRRRRRRRRHGSCGAIGGGGVGRRCGRSRLEGRDAALHRERLALGLREGVGLLMTARVRGALRVGRIPFGDCPILGHRLGALTRGQLQRKGSRYRGTSGLVRKQKSQS